MLNLGNLNGLLRNGTQERDSFLLVSSQGNLENHDFVSKDVFTVSNTRNDLGQLWPRMENILKELVCTFACNFTDSSL